MAAQYDLSINKNTVFSAWIQLLQDDDTPIDLDAYTAELKIERYVGSDYPLALASTNGVTYGYTSSTSPGTAATSGGIQLNKNYTGSGITGGIFIEMNKETTNSLPAGKQFYNIRLEYGTSYSEILLEGRIDVKAE